MIFSGVAHRFTQMNVLQCFVMGNHHDWYMRIGLEKSCEAYTNTFLNKICSVM